MIDLMDRLPPNYRGSPEVALFQGALQAEVEGVWSAREDLAQQLDPRTATWGLSYWESALGLEASDAKDTDDRRSRVISKLRGRGTTTVGLIQSVAESFANGEVEVVEDAANCEVSIRFVGEIGAPPNLDDLSDALDDIMPAHLAWSYVIRYRRHSELAGMTYGQLATYTHGQLREEAEL